MRVLRRAPLPVPEASGRRHRPGLHLPLRAPSRQHRLGHAIAPLGSDRLHTPSPRGELLLHNSEYILAEWWITQGAPACFGSARTRTHCALTSADLKPAG